MLFQALLIFIAACDTDFSERIHYHYISGLFALQLSTSNQRQLTFIMYSNYKSCPVEVSATFENRWNSRLLLLARPFNAPFCLWLISICMRLLQSVSLFTVIWVRTLHQLYCRVSRVRLLHPGSTPIGHCSWLDRHHQWRTWPTFSTSVTVMIASTMAISQLVTF
jgi:hypothetical protein